MTPQHDTSPSRMTFCGRSIKRVIFQKYWRAPSIFQRASRNPLIHKSFWFEAPALSTGLMLPHSHPPNAMLVTRAALRQNFHPLDEILHLLQDLQFCFASICILFALDCLILTASGHLWGGCPIKMLVHWWTIMPV